MRWIVGLALLLGACATSSAQPTADSIQVVYHAGVMEYSIEDGGRARMIGADSERVFEFDATHEDFRRIATMLAPLQAEGLTCSSPPEHTTPGYIIWRQGGQEMRRAPMHTLCYSDGARPLARNADQAWRAMEEMGSARYVAPTIPEPAIISVEYMYWGNPTSSWSVARSGEGRYTHDGQTETFAVSDAQFGEIREIFRPYESRWFRCNRVITDGPYGDVIWSSREGQEHQRTRFDAGCVTGDANDLFDRLDRAKQIIDRLRSERAN